ncbi:Erg28-like protein [Pluteus cervinus]|uniref:Erg28-like protein n=1 Tax=Pluteus cervinus TaxID=181527 RepID=A0ACD3B4M2_9AGAR|nr:Erg28-like protein [Pluteus cervinus]
MDSILPGGAGLLPKWQLFVSATAVFNFVQNLVTLDLTRRVYNNVPPSSVTALQARTFGIWTLTSAVVRFYAAYNIENPAIYQMAFITYLIAFGHFGTELFVFRTARINPGVLSPVIVSSITLAWMYSQWDFYVRS